MKIGSWVGTQGLVWFGTFHMLIVVLSTSVVGVGF